MKRQCPHLLATDPTNEVPPVKTLYAARVRQNVDIYAPRAQQCP